jgi:hypothetical protein
MSILSARPPVCAPLATITCFGDAAVTIFGDWVYLIFDYH